MRFDLGKGWMIEFDLPPENICKTMERWGRLMKKGDRALTERERAEVVAVRSWLVQQRAKHGEMKPVGEQPADYTVSFSSQEEKELYWQQHRLRKNRRRDFSAN